MRTAKYSDSLYCSAVCDRRLSPLIELRYRKGCHRCDSERRAVAMIEVKENVRSGYFVGHPLGQTRAGHSLRAVRQDAPGCRTLLAGALLGSRKGLALGAGFLLFAQLIVG